MTDDTVACARPAPPRYGSAYKCAILVAVNTSDVAVSSAAASRYPCTRCGADTALQPGSDSLVCASCGHVGRIEVEQAPIHEHDFTQALQRLRSRPANELTIGGREVQCQNCGARTVIDKQATRCPFCDNALVVELTTSDVTIEPQNVLPFVIDQNAASDHFRHWIGRRWFAPMGLAKRVRHEGLDGVYLPYWSYDSVTDTRYHGQRGDHYYVTESYNDSQGKRQTRQVRKTRWRSASGAVQVRFDDILVCASKSLPSKLITALEPWDLGQLKPFDGKFLAGFVAERYQLGLEDGFVVAETIMEPQIRSAIRRDIGGDEQRIHDMNVRHDDVTFKHLLLPLWVSSFRFHDRVYRVTVNARTGEVAGERPWSWVKITLFTLAIAAVIAVIVSLAAQP